MELNERFAPKENEAEKHEPNVLPATEIAKNPNPRSNENIKNQNTKSTKTPNGVGSEITDGEDG